jgi:hypothetical protein
MPRKVNPGFRKYVRAMQLSKGLTCNRKILLRKVKAGASPEAAVAQVCWAGVAGLDGAKRRKRAR